LARLKGFLLDLDKIKLSAFLKRDLAFGETWTVPLFARMVDSTLELHIVHMQDHIENRREQMMVAKGLGIVWVAITVDHYAKMPITPRWATAYGSLACSVRCWHRRYALNVLRSPNGPYW